MDGDEEEQTRQLKELDTRYQRQGKNYEEMPGSERGKYLSNKTHYSPTDPDARIAVKPGKPRELYYSGQIAVDTGHHVIIPHMRDRKLYSRWKRLQRLNNNNRAVANKNEATWNADRKALRGWRLQQRRKLSVPGTKQHHTIYTIAGWLIKRQLRIYL
jgi:hypothetical protein